MRYYPLVALLLLCSHLVQQAQAEDSLRLCTSCHAPQLQGSRALQAPKLNGLPAWYVEAQLHKFITQQRSYPQMLAASASLTPADIKQVAAAIEELPASPVEPSIDGNAKVGARIYAGSCGACHGPEGSGNPAMGAPPLAGQSDWYLAKQLEDFRAGRRGSHPDDQRGQQMQMMAKSLPGGQPENDVLSYLNSVQPRR